MADALSDDVDRPEPNVFDSSLQCQRCGETVNEAYYDGRAQALLWWCSKGHESIIEELAL